MGWRQIFCFSALSLLFLTLAGVNGLKCKGKAPACSTSPTRFYSRPEFSCPYTFAPPEGDPAPPGSDPVPPPPDLQDAVLTSEVVVWDAADWHDYPGRTVACLAYQQVRPVVCDVTAPDLQRARAKSIAPITDPNYRVVRLYVYRSEPPNTRDIMADRSESIGAVDCQIREGEPRSNAVFPNWEPRWDNSTAGAL
eukprot:gnl/Hemi2/1063_TR382_c0_g1_i1.p2 gnl/Hemi2/1063_TR382_c0_g1~~gnl/Hemi2/1063_TR382_c0_g1_i1.p2  ORF type:complete len:195 (-),score=25.04 gnl/Hemi2/1063_TR382_c0_g1_i1:120-704(-)